MEALLVSLMTDRSRSSLSRTAERTRVTSRDEVGSSRPKRTRVTEIVEEAMLSRVHHEFLLSGTCNKAAKTKLGGHGHSLTLLEFARYLGLYHSHEICEEGFEVYFQGSLRSDEHFNARDYWLSISSEDELHLSRSATQTIRHPVLKVLRKIITHGLCQRKTGFDKIQRNELWLISMFEARHHNGIVKKMSLLTDEVLDGQSAPIYCRSLDATTLRELIGSNGRLIAEDPTLGVPKVAMLRPLRPTIQDLYDRMGRIEIRHGTLQRMSRRQSYYSDRYVGVFEDMVGQYNIPLQGAYAPPGYDKE
ncbi:hypothetical protein Tco_0318018 [Tanacetum coccineum]